ncbi:MAG TPA: hemopexin repeat-containing protein, partial [Kofleriaceae bacterium]
MKSSFTSLFGPIDHAEGNESRSVLSPAAYLVDLLELRDSIVTGWTDYHARRPDVRGIHLDQASTFTEIPFLDVANAVMGAATRQLVGGTEDVDTVVGRVLTGTLFPPPLPFSEQHLRLQLYAGKLGTSLDEIQRLYRASADAHLSARLRLGLGPEEYALFSTAHDSDDGIKKLWGVSDLAALDGSDVGGIEQKLGLSRKELKQLVRQDLSAAELSEPRDPSKPKRNAAESFFINQGPSYLVLDEAPLKLHLKDGSKLSNQHLDRMMRFVRLARRLDLELADLDWLLQTACGNVLDGDALQAIAIALDLRKATGLPIDEICSLWSVAKDHGQGDGPIPADLFDRAYNNDVPITLEALVAGLAAGATVDALDDRLQATLRVSGADFAFLKAALLARGVARPTLAYPAIVAWFSAFRRIATLATMLALSVREVVMLLDVLGAQWTVSEHEDLSIAMPFSAAALPTTPLGLLVQPDAPPRRTMDVVQKLFRVKAWLDLRQLSARQLAYLCLEDHLDARQRLDDGPPIDDVQPDDAVEAALTDLQQSLLDAMVVPSALQTGSLTADGARAVFDALRDARVLVTFDDPARGLLRVQPSDGELAAAMQSGIHERLEVHASDFAALGLTDADPLFSLLVAHGYLDRREETVEGELEVHHVIAPGLDGYFASPGGAATFTLPSFQAHAEAIFSVLAQRVDAARVDAAALAATGIDGADVPALFAVLQAHGYAEPVPGSTPIDYRVLVDAKPFFSDPANLAKFALPDFTTAFAVLAAKVAAFQRGMANLPTEAQELGGRLSASSDQQIRAWLRSLSGLIGLAEDVTALAFAWAFGTPDETMTQTLAALALPLFRARQQSQPALGDAYLASRCRRLQQLALLLRKTAMTADQARVYLTNQQVHRRLPETLNLPDGLLSSGKIDALATLPGGDLVVISGPTYAQFSQHDDHLVGTGTLDQIPGVALPDAFRARVRASGIDAAFNDNGALQLCAGDQYVTVSAAGTSAAKPISDWGQVRNNLQQHARVDAAVQAKDGRLFLFSGDQYVLYSAPQQLLAGPAFVDERYPRSIRGKFENEGVSPLPALMFSGVDAAFRDTDDTYYFFAGNRFSHSTDPFNVVKIRPVWGHVLNDLFEDNRVDAAFVLGGVTYLTRRNQLLRYTGSAYQIVDEGFPISFGNVADSEPLLRVLRRFPNGLDAALAGSDGKLYAFKDGAYASSAAPDTSLTIRDHWGRVRNVFVDNQRVDAALAYGGAVYLFSGDQYVRYSGASYQLVDEGYPRRVRPSWNALEKIGVVPDGLPLPITAVAVGRAPGGTSDDVYFFAGNQFAGPTGALDDIKARWARVRNNLGKVGVVDAAMLDGSGRMYLFSGDQYYRYSSPDQTFVDETYPRRLAGNWVQEGSGYALPDAFAGGISAALRTTDGTLYFFSGQSYARVDTAPATPRANNQDWGVVRNVIQAQNAVGAAYVDPAGKTYVLGGDQVVRYTGTAYDVVDEGFPLAIATRWPSLPASFRSDIDAALVFKSPVDNVQRLYLFKGDSYCRFSTGDFTQLDAGYPRRYLDAIQAEGLWFRGLAVHEPNPNSSHQDDPIASVEAIYVDTFGGQPRINVFYRHDGGIQWRRIFQSGNWGAPVRVETLSDYLPFTRLDAALVATDGTLHAFSGNQYASRPPAGGPLTAPVPINSRWARVFNQFADLGRVDACLTMGDGRTYLFCARQFIKYTGTLRPGAADFFVDEGYPLRIDPNWPAQGVPVTLAPELQAAGYDLCRDATGKVHFFNGTRYAVSGTAGDVLLTSRWGKVENRFQDLDRVDAAYRAENNKLYLFCDTQYTRYSGALQPGSPDFYADEGYPRHVTTGWASEGLPIALPAVWNALGSAIFRDAQQTYVFSGSSFTSSQSPAPAPVIPQWAKVRNQIQSQNRVDAGFVLGQGAGAVTLVFCDDQYVRYSGAYDGFVDEGYPKVIAHLAAADGAFPGLPDPLPSGLRGFFAGTDGNLHAFGPQPSDASQPQLYVSSAGPATLRPLDQRWGIVDNKLWDNEFVNAALVAGGKLFLFSGD